MSSVHANPAANGTVFGQATVTVDLEAGDCVVRSVRPGPCGDIPQSMRLNSIDEIQGAYQVQFGLGATDAVAADVARALKFAGQQLRNHSGDRRRG